MSPFALKTLKIRSPYTRKRRRLFIHTVTARVFLAGCGARPLQRAGAALAAGHHCSLRWLLLQSAGPSRSSSCGTWAFSYSAARGDFLGLNLCLCISGQILSPGPPGMPPEALGESPACPPPPAVTSPSLRHPLPSTWTGPSPLWWFRGSWACVWLGRAGAGLCHLQVSCAPLFCLSPCPCPLPPQPQADCSPPGLRVPVGSLS